MELSYLLTHRRNEHRDILYLVDSEESARVRDTLESDEADESLVSDGGIPLEWLLLKARDIVLTSKLVHSSKIADALCRAHLRGAKITDLSIHLASLDRRSAASAAGFLKQISLPSLRRDQGRQLYRHAKNIVEPVFALVLLILLSPLLALVSLVVKLTSPGPALYSQTRSGLGGAGFELYKFRSMRTEAELSGPRWASADPHDSRLTPIGGFLRASHLDELPQLWNILRGEMSFIGPRPERPCFVREISLEVPLFRLRTLVKPGITGWAQVQMGYANTLDDSRRKLEFDLFYLLRHSLWLDFKIVLLTFRVLFSGGTEGKKRDLLQRLRSRRALKTPRREVQTVAE